MTDDAARMESEITRILSGIVEEGVKELRRDVDRSLVKLEESVGQLAIRVDRVAYDLRRLQEKNANRHLQFDEAIQALRHGQVSPPTSDEMKRDDQRRHEMGIIVEQLETLTDIAQAQVDRTEMLEAWAHDTGSWIASFPALLERDDK